MTNETVTMTRAEYEALMERLQDAEDMATVNARRNEERIPGDMVTRMLAGESRIAVWREHRGLTQRALADAAAISPAMMNEIEKGKRQPSLDKARAIAAALTVGLDDLWLDADPTP